jgi:tRNA(Arg) A34 adenosine deaminase TadA
MNMVKSWTDLPLGARAALEEQWAGLAAGGLPCGSAIVDARGVVAVGRNRAYDAAGAIHTRMQHPLQHTRLAHAELNALAHVPTETDHASLTLWSTQHPCAMCAAAIAFVGICRVRYLADDPSGASSPADNIASRNGIDYQPLGDPLCGAGRRRGEEPQDQSRQIPVPRRVDARTCPGRCPGHGCPAGDVTPQRPGSVSSVPPPRFGRRAVNGNRWATSDVKRLTGDHPVAMMA